MTEPPHPFTTPNIDVRDLDAFMLNAERLLASELWALSTGEEFKAAMGLWCRAWKQIPAGSLPDDDRVLASFACVHIKRWPRVRDIAMRGFVKCSDGRLYHPTLCEDARRAFEKKTTNRLRGRSGADARWGKKASPEDAPSNAPSIGQALVGDGQGQYRDSTGTGTVPGESTRATPTDVDRWPYERQQPWARALVGCKIGAQNWPAWKALTATHGHDRVAQVAKSVPPTERWPDRVEEALAAARSQDPIADAVSRKTERITL